jgi:hypothetical protein
MTDRRRTALAAPPVVVTPRAERRRAMIRHDDDRQIVRTERPAPPRPPATGPRVRHRPNARRPSRPREVARGEQRAEPIVWADRACRCVASESAVARTIDDTADADDDPRFEPIPRARETTGAACARERRGVRQGTRRARIHDASAIESAPPPPNNADPVCASSDEKKRVAAGEPGGGCCHVR